MKHFAPLSEVDTPHRRARQQWDERLGKAWQHGHYWMIAFFVILGWHLWAGYRDKRLEAIRLAKPIEIFYVGMDSNAVGTLLGQAPLHTAPPPAALEERVRSFVFHSRRKILGDAVELNRLWKDSLYNWVTPRGATLLNEWAQERRDLLRNPKISITVDLTRVVLKSDGSFDVWWTETKRDHNNAIAMKDDLSSWTGTYTVLVEKPKDKKQLMANVTGVFVDYFNVTRAK
jgi:type IV secretion system protein TrbF